MLVGILYGYHICFLKYAQQTQHLEASEFSTLTLPTVKHLSTRVFIFRCAEVSHLFMLVAK